MNNHKLEMILT